MKDAVPPGPEPGKKLAYNGEFGNRFLNKLPGETVKRILSQATAVELPLRSPLYLADAPKKYVFFLTSGLASVVFTSERGKSIELATIGCEGLVGWLSLLGGMDQVSESMMQMAGAGYRVPLATMQQEFDANAVVRHLVLEFAQHQTIMAYQLVACNRLHQAGQRFSRWLLMVSDRVGKQELPMTQEFLADMLGTRRTTVAEEAGVLQRAGAIEYSRGVVRIVNRAILEKHTCECYSILHLQFEQLYNTPDATT